MALAIRTIGEPAELTHVLRGLLRDVDPAMALGSVMTMEDRLLETLAGPRLYSAMLLGFAGLSMTIAGVGLFGVLSFGVAQRSRELAVRSALGASPGALVSLVIRHDSP